MDIDALLLQSLQLLGLGMGAVFIILTALIVLINFVSRIVPEEVSAPAITKTHGVDPAHVAAISAAIRQYRKQAGKN